MLKLCNECVTILVEDKAVLVFIVLICVGYGYGRSLNMKAVATLFPVFFMIGLGMLARIKGLATHEQKDGANHIVFNVLFPILIFHILFNSTIQLSAMYLVAYVFVVFGLMMFAGKLLGKFTGTRFQHISYFMLTTCEGGSVALPLYLSIVGASSNTVIFDLAGIMYAFVIIPVMVSRASAGSTSKGQMIKSIFTNAFVIAVILGLGLNMLGVNTALANSQFNELYTNTMAQATAPIIGIILFVIGYNLKIQLDTLGDVLKLLLVRIGGYALVIAGFFLLFPNMMADKIFMIAVLIYFMSPTGFVIPMQLEPLYKNEDEESYTAAILSLNMIVTLIVYALVVVFIA